MFAPDLIAVLDVESHRRSSWIVNRERRGIDFVLEVTLAGDRKKDLETNVKRYARLGIPEYFILDLKLRRIVGYRAGSAGVYESIVPLPDAEELIERLESMVGDLVSKEESLAKELEEALARAEAEKARAERLLARLRELGYEDEPES
jgi:Uma2 family endonuclease